MQQLWWKHSLTEPKSKPVNSTASTSLPSFLTEIVKVTRKSIMEEMFL